MPRATGRAIQKGRRWEKGRREAEREGGGRHARASSPLAIGLMARMEMVRLSLDDLCRQKGPNGRGGVGGTRERGAGLILYGSRAAFRALHGRNRPRPGRAVERGLLSSKPARCPYASPGGGAHPSMLSNLHAVGMQE